MSASCGVCEIRFGLQITRFINRDRICAPHTTGTNSLPTDDENQPATALRVISTTRCFISGWSLCALKSPIGQSTFNSGM
jgi:hypothetical protein